MKKVIFLVVAFFALMVNVNAANNNKTDKIDTIFIGDSYCTGVNYNNANNDQQHGWAYKTATKLGTDNYYISCKGGTGFVREKDGIKFINLLEATDSKLTNSNVKLVIVAGGWNDAVIEDISSEQMATAINAFITKSKQLYPNAQIVFSMIGWSSSDERVESRNRLTSIVEPAWEQGASNNNILYIPNGKNVLVNHPEYFSNDGLHPLDAGYDAIADLVANYIRANTLNIKYTDDNTTYDYVVGKGGKFKTRSKEGYDFKGWKTSEDGNVVYQGNENITDTIIKNNGSILLYPKYTEKYYTITKGEDDNVKISIENESELYQANSTIKYTVTIKDGYKINNVNVKYGTNEPVENSYAEGHGSFKMPFKNVVIGVEYSKLENESKHEDTTPKADQNTNTPSSEQKKDVLENPNTGIKKPGIIFGIIVVISFITYIIISNKKILKK